MPSGVGRLRTVLVCWLGPADRRRTPGVARYPVFDVVTVALGLKARRVAEARD
ncbi:MAG: hypothetical protein R3F45_14080 [Gammaproteobacteria bacterium]